MPEKIAARIESFSVKDEIYTIGDRVRVYVRVSNIGAQKQTFFVRISPRGPDGHYWNSESANGKLITLDDGETHSVTLSWEVEENVPEGTYDLDTSIWKENNPNNLQTRLDLFRRTNAFEIEPDLDSIENWVDSLLESEDDDFTSGDAWKLTSNVLTLYALGEVGLKTIKHAQARLSEADIDTHEQQAKLEDYLDE